MSKKTFFGMSFVVTSFIGLVVGLFFYIPSDPTFRPWSNYFCDVASGPIGGIIAVGIGLGLAALSLAMLHITIAKDLRKKSDQKFLISLYLVTGILSTITLLILGIFPLNPTMPTAFKIHSLVAIFYWTFYGVSFISLGILEYSNTKIASIFVILGGFFALFFAVGFPLQENGIIVKNAFVYLSMWSAFFLVVLWVIIKIVKYWRKSV